MTTRVGIDTGGTFTDLVALDGNGLRVHKVQSTPDDPARAIIAGLTEMGLLGPSPDGSRHGSSDPASIDIVHGSTVATNALLERKGARLALVTTEKFEDILRIGRQTRRELYDPFVEAPRPLVDSSLTFGVAERVLADGSIERPLGEDAIQRLIDDLEKSKPEAVAICLLHAYANPVHERMLARRLVSAGYRVSQSNEVLAEYREFERCSTTAVNAYVAPMMASYLMELSTQLGEARPLRVMQSNGGVISVEAASQRAVQTVLSGPAGGVVGAAAIARAAGFSRVIAFDMGGTSTDVSLIDEVPARTTEAVVGDFPIRLPLLDIQTVGAGGGSIAYVDPGGSLRVGPQSAGARPGPACYGEGDEPTVTDANLVLGRIDPRRFLGGRMTVSAERAKRALGVLADRAGLDVESLAEGIIRIANANMERAIRVVSVERGHDPRDFALVPFGGAGGLHACALADSLDIPLIVVPAHPGVLSALGMLLSDSVVDQSRTLLGDLSAIDAVVLDDAFEQLTDDVLARLRADGFADEDIRLEPSLDLRYAGQAYELNVLLAGPSPASTGRDRARGDFHVRHQQRYGYANEARAVELVNVRVRGVGVTRKPDLNVGGAVTGRTDGMLAPPRPATAGDGRQAIATFERTGLTTGDTVRGPALIVDEGSTMFLAGHWQAGVDAMRNLIVRRVRSDESDEKGAS